MSQTLTLADAQNSLSAHVAAKGAEIHAKYGPNLGWQELERLLLDRDCVRYPCEIAFDAAPLRDGEFAYAQPQGERPEDGYRINVHPFFSTQPALVPALVLYQLVQVNYGDFASPDDAEAFGAAALGVDPEAYYTLLCESADLVSEGVATAPPLEEVPAGSSGCCGGGGGTCGCGSGSHS
jgi:hypothetical protein